MNKACSVCGGACCMGMVLDPTRYGEDVKLWVELHGQVTKHGVLLNVPCQALSRGECLCWSSRPRVCRDFGVGSEGCIEAIHRYAPEKYESIAKHFNKE